MEEDEYLNEEDEENQVGTTETVQNLEVESQIVADQNDGEQNVSNLDVNEEPMDTATEPILDSECAFQEATTEEKVEDVTMDESTTSESLDVPNDVAKNEVEEQTEEQAEEVASTEPPCPFCEDSGPQFGKFRKIPEKLKKGQKVQYVWRYKCRVKSCNQFFGDYFRYSADTMKFVQVAEDGKPLPQSTVDGIPAAGTDMNTSFSEDCSGSDGSPLKSPESCGSTQQSTSFGAPPNTTVVTTVRIGRRIRFVDEKSTGSAVPPAPESQETTSFTAETVAVEESTSMDAEPIEPTAEQGATETQPVQQEEVSETSQDSLPGGSESGQIAGTIEGQSDSAKGGKNKGKKGNGKRGRPPTVNANGAIPKKPKKGYGYVLEPVVPKPPPKAPSVPVFPTFYNNGRLETFEEATQTDAESLLISSLVDEVITGNAELLGADKSKDSITAHLSRRLILCQKIIETQAAQCRTLRAEKQEFEQKAIAVVKSTKAFRNTCREEMRRFRDDVIFQKEEQKFYHNELTSDARKSLENIRKEKQFVDAKVNELSHQNIRLQGLLDLRVSELKAARLGHDTLTRKLSLKERDVLRANKARDDSEKKLNDSLYITNNAKCVHCQVSDRMRNNLTGQVAEMTNLLKKTQKERDQLFRRVDHQEKVLKVVQKDAQRLQFEINAHKAERDRLLAEVDRLRARGPASQSSTPRPSTTPRGGGATPSSLTNGLITPSESGNEKNQSPPEEGELSLHASPDAANMSPGSLSTLPPPPAPPGLFANWIPNKSDSPSGSSPAPNDKVRFFSSVPATRHGHAGGTCRGPPAVASPLTYDSSFSSLSDMPVPILSKKEKKAQKKAAEKARLEKGRQELRQQRKVEAAKKAADAAEKEKQAQLDREEADRKRAEDLAARLKAKKEASEKAADSPKGPHKPLLLQSTKRIPKKSDINGSSAEKDGSSSKDSVSTPTPAKKSSPVVEKETAAKGKPAAAPPSKATPAAAIAPARNPQPNKKNLEEKDWKEEMIRQQESRMSRSRNNTSHSLLGPAFAKPTNGPVPFNGPRSLPQNAPALIKQVAPPRPFNGPIARRDAHPLPFEPIDESWGPGTRGGRPPDRHFREPQPWQTSPAAVPRDPPGPPPTIWRPREESWGQPSSFSSSRGLGWSDSDNWSTQPEPARIAPAQPQRGPPSGQQRRNFWDA